MNPLKIRRRLVGSRSAAVRRSVIALLVPLLPLLVAACNSKGGAGY